jgi:Uma2 family endonuclease
VDNSNAQSAGSASIDQCLLTMPGMEWTMTSMTVMPRGTEWTVDDLDRVPDDGLQYELLDGVLLVTPAPIPVHQRAIGKLFLLLQAACTPDYEVFVSPLDWRPDLRTSLQPDVLVVQADGIGPKNIQVPLALAVEVLSPSTRRKDQLLKRSKYQDSGVSSYWIVDPIAPSIEALHLADGRYLTEALATGEDVVTIRHPFPVAVRPADLIRR